MNTYTQILYQIVFGTKNHERTLKSINRIALFKYIHGILKNKRCFLYRINGVEDHLHILTHLHPAVSLSSLVKDIKLASSGYIKTQKLFPNFRGWQEGYGGFTYAYKEKNNLIEYVKNQAEHHKVITYKEELIELFEEHGIEYDERYFF